MISLFVTRGNEKGRMFDVSSDGATIGRDLQNHVCITDMESSRAHCQIVSESGQPKLIDLQSSNGTTVNGQIVTKTAIKVGDQIQVGQTVFVVLSPSSIPAAPGPTSGIPRAKIASTLTPGPVSADSQDDNDRFVAVMKSNLQFIYNASIATSQKAVGPMLDDVLNLIFDWTAADRGCILLRDGPKKSLQARAVKHRDITRNNEKLNVSRSILKHVDDKAEGVVFSDLNKDGSVAASQSVKASGISEVICVPILGRNYSLGLIYIDRLLESPQLDNCFGEDHLKLLHVIAHQTAVAIENEEYYATLLEKERMLAVGETAEKLSHRIKNILQSINGGAFLVDEGLTNADLATAEKGWAIVKRNQDRISKLVLEMLLVNNEYVPEKDSFCVLEMVDSAVASRRAEAESLSVQIKFTCSLRPLEIVGDRRSLQDAVAYVIGEAIKNSRGVDNPCVSVRLETNMENIEIFVKSAEADVDDENPETNYKSEIFSAAKEFFPGLELSASQKILRGHNGNVEISNARTHEHYRIWFPVQLESDTAANTVVLPHNFEK